MVMNAELAPFHFLPAKLMSKPRKMGANSTQNLSTEQALINIKHRINHKTTRPLKSPHKSVTPKKHINGEYPLQKKRPKALHTEVYCKQLNWAI
jgi:hypothetical protein